jgi:methylated-DNA-[protein]-cysteine S-methyltransferase
MPIHRSSPGGLALPDKPHGGFEVEPPAGDSAETASTIVASPLGNLRLVASGGALTAVAWTDAAPSGATNDPILQAAAEQLARYFDDSRHAFDLPLQPKGDAFERAVWQAMCAIPSGETATYGAIGLATDKPARAVGGACGRNPIPIIIPCHRVVGANGAMTGYSGKGGVETKQWLLRHEGALLI